MGGKKKRNRAAGRIALENQDSLAQAQQEAQALYDQDIAALRDASNVTDFYAGLDFSSIDPLEMIRMVATARIIMPKSRIRLSAGRQQLGREAQILCLQSGADSIFYGDTLLTTSNPEVEADRKLLADAGITANFSQE